jgi:benzoyl-CoA reductase/2-hydroxyglutaryl-CoA dehydratase subunit BcrC/BadD/HgdB
VEIIPFDYPPDRDACALRQQIQHLAHRLSAEEKSIRQAGKRLRPIRQKLMEIDRLTFEANKVTGLENHLSLVNSTDFNSDPELFEKRLDDLIRETDSRPAIDDRIRLGFVGVPPIFSGFYEVVESLGARIVFNEVQRQFSMPQYKKDLIHQYLSYTYPYGAQGRIRDISRAIRERRLDGIIHYTQTFCYRQIYDIIFREQIELPILTLEGDRPGEMDSRTANRLETFIEMLKSRKE